MVEYFPLSHKVHVVAAPTEKRPATQGDGSASTFGHDNPGPQTTQSDQLANEYVPAAQELTAPVEVQVNPAGQGSQLVASVASAKRPVAQGIGASLATEQLCPVGHGEQDCEPDCVV